MGLGKKSENMLCCNQADKSCDTRCGDIPRRIPISNAYISMTAFLTAAVDITINFSSDNDLNPKR